VHYTKQQLEEKRLEFYDKDDYLLFLIKESIKKRKEEIVDKKRHKSLAFNDATNCFILTDPNFSLIKKIENENFYLLFPGDFTKNKETLMKALELYLEDRAYVLKGKFEYLGLFQETLPWLELKKLVKLLPPFYYNTLYKFGLTISYVSLSLNEEEFILKLLKTEDLEKDEVKDEIINFMDYFNLKFLIRKGQKPFNLKLDKKHYLISLGNNIALIDTEIKIFDREALLKL